MPPLSRLTQCRALPPRPPHSFPPLRALQADPLGMASAPDVTAAQLEGSAHLTLPGANSTQGRGRAAGSAAAKQRAGGGHKSKPTSFGEYLGDEFKPRKPVRASCPRSRPPSPFRKRALAVNRSASLLALKASPL